MQVQGLLTVRVAAERGKWFKVLSITCTHSDAIQVVQALRAAMKHNELDAIFQPYAESL
jgi:hypothetical protein